MRDNSERSIIIPSYMIKCATILVHLVTTEARTLPIVFRKSEMIMYKTYKHCSSVRWLASTQS